MHRLTNHSRSERGAVAIIVAMLFGFGVMAGAAALTIDVGNINADRRQLQNGADAAVLSAAQDCVKSVCPDPSPTTGTVAQKAQAQTNYDRLGTLANINAADGATKIARVDGSQAVCGTAPGLKPCTAGTSTTRLQECPGSPFPSTLAYARVYTQTLDTSGHTILPYSFGAIIAGAGSGANQQACASAAWGPAKSVPAAFPVTFSDCEWQADKGFQALPPVGPGLGYAAAGNTTGNTVWPVAESEIVLASAKKTTDCTSWNGHVAPGNFGHLNNIACNASPVDGWIQGDSGNPAPCSDVDLHKKVGTIVYIPIFDCFTNTDPPAFTNCTSGKNHDWFHMTGYAPFYLTGFYFSGSGSEGNDIFPNSTQYGSKPCSGSTRCISGWFTTSTLPTTIDTGGGPSFGSTAIQLAG